MAADSHNFHRTHDTRNQEPGFPSEIPVIFSNLQFLRIWKLMVLLCVYALPFPTTLVLSLSCGISLAVHAFFGLGICYSKLAKWLAVPTP